MLLAFFVGWATFAFGLFDLGRFSITLLILASIGLTLLGFRPTPLNLLTGWVLLTSTLLALCVALLVNPGSARTYTHFFQSLLAIGVMLNVASMDWERQLSRMRWTMLTVAASIVVFGCYQLIARNFDLPFAFLPITNQQLLSDEGLQRGYGTVFLGAGSFTRVSSFFPEPSDLGRFMLWVFVIGFASARQFDKLVFMGLGMVGIILSQSMGAMLGFAVFLPLAMLVKRDARGGLQALLVVIVATISLVIIFPTNASLLLERAVTILTERENYLMETQRFAYIGEGLRVFLERPLVGHGIGSLRSVVSPDAVISSTFLLNLIERGLAGSFLYYAPFFCIFLLLACKNTARDETTQTALFLLLCELYFFSTFAMPYFPPTYFALGFAVAELARSYRYDVPRQTALSSHLPKVAAADAVPTDTSPEVLIIDARANTPAYDSALLMGLRRLGQRAVLFTADFYPEPYAPAHAVDGRVYYFMRLSRQLRRRLRHSRFGNKVAIFLGPLEYVFDLFRLAVHCTMHRPILHIQWLFVIPADILFLSYAKLLGLHVIYTVHNPLPHDSSSRVERFLYGSVYHLADELIFHCTATLEEFRAYYTVAPEKCSIVPCGVFFADRQPVQKVAAREVLGWPKDDLIMVFEGHVKPYKGLDVLLRAIADLNCNAKGVRLVVSANFRFARMDQYNDLFEKVREKVALDIFDEIPSDQRFVHIACAADLFVLPYRAGTASMTGMTAVRFGTPLIVTRVGALPDMLGESWKEFVVAPDNANALRIALERFLALSSNERNSITEYLLRRGKEYFGWDETARKTVAIYHKPR